MLDIDIDNTVFELFIINFIFNNNNLVVRIYDLLSYTLSSLFRDKNSSLVRLAAFYVFLKYMLCNYFIIIVLR